MYVDQATLQRAVDALRGTADPLLKVWLALKHLGFAATGGAPVVVDTKNPLPAVEALFGGARLDGVLYVPFSRTVSDTTIVNAETAARDGVQSNMKRFMERKVTGVDPTGFLTITQGDDKKFRVRPSRTYPQGLGRDRNGFAPRDGCRLAVPLTAFAVWYGRVTDIPAEAHDPAAWLVEHMLEELHISRVEQEVVFGPDSLLVETDASPLTREQMHEICTRAPTPDSAAVVVPEDESAYLKRVRAIAPDLDKPVWLRADPDALFRRILDTGYRAVLLYGPPRTGKSRAVDAYKSRADEDRETIQIHDGWGYDYLVQGLRNVDGRWVWKSGPLKRAIQGGSRFIVLEEINRTSFSQALGEVFSLIEPAYRGRANGIRLRGDGGDDEVLWVHPDTVFVFTMNTLDRSTEEVDDALFGRVAAIECPPRPEDLAAILHRRCATSEVHKAITLLFGEILEVYPLGHGYFADLPLNASRAQALDHYITRVRPVLQSALGADSAHLASIDNVAGDLLAPAG